MDEQRDQNEDVIHFMRRQCEATEDVAENIKSLKWTLFFAILAVGLGLEIAIMHAV